MYNILDYGAVNDININSTKAIQKAIDACRENGGGTVFVPTGKYTIASLILCSNLHFMFEAGAYFYGSKNIDDYIKGKVAQTAFTKELDESIARMKQEKEERNMYLTYTSRMMECRRDGYEEGLHTGREEGISIGLERGAYQKALETAKKLLLRGYSSEDIADLSGLTLSQVQELLNL